MNELATNTGLPLSHIPTTPFPANTSFLESLTETHLYHLQNPHNLSPDEQNARRRFIARHSLKDLIPKYATQDDGGPFPLFSDDLQPTNILINPPTHGRSQGSSTGSSSTPSRRKFTHDPLW
jgi:hypothetical protein